MCALIFLRVVSHMLVYIVHCLVLRGLDFVINSLLQETECVPLLPTWRVYDMCLKSTFAVTRKDKASNWKNVFLLPNAVNHLTPATCTSKFRKAET